MNTTERRPIKWLLILAACFLAMMLVEEVPAQTMEPVIINTPTGTTVCVEVMKGVWSCS